MSSLFFMNSTHEKAINTIKDTLARNDRGVQAESDQYIKGWEDAFATVENTSIKAARLKSKTGMSTFPDRAVIENEL